MNISRTSFFETIRCTSENKKIIKNVKLDEYINRRKECYPYFHMINMKDVEDGGGRGVQVLKCVII